MTTLLYATYAYALTYILFSFINHIKEVNTVRYISKPTYKYDRELARTVVQDQIKRAAQNSVRTSAFDNFVTSSFSSASVSCDCPVQIIVSNSPGRCFSSHARLRSSSRGCRAVTSTSRYPRFASAVRPSFAPGTAGARSR